MKFRCTVPIKNRRGGHTIMRDVEALSLDVARREFLRKFKRIAGAPSNTFQGFSDGGHGRRNDRNIIASAVE